LMFTEKFIKPYVSAQLEMDFELDPSKNLKYS
jgi:hypothetical protein